MLKSPRSQQHLYMNTQGLCMNATGVLGFSNYATVCILIPCKQKNNLKKCACTLPEASFVFSVAPWKLYHFEHTCYSLDGQKRENWSPTVCELLIFFVVFFFTFVVDLFSAPQLLLFCWRCTCIFLALNSINHRFFLASSSFISLELFSTEVHTNMGIWCIVA